MTIMQVPIPKGKGVVEIDTSSIPEAVYAEALLQGLKVLCTRGMSKVTVKDLGSEEEVRKEAMIIAEQNIAKLKAGDIKFTGKPKATTQKLDKAVNVEAMRIARDRVRDGLRSIGKRPENYKASQISEAAKVLVADDPSIVELAQANLTKRAETPSTIDLSALVAGIKEDSAKVKKAEEKKAADKAKRAMSANEAGKIRGRQPKKKPEARANA